MDEKLYGTLSGSNNLSAALFTGITETANKAICDGEGNVIVDTYERRLDFIDNITLEGVLK